MFIPAEAQFFILAALLIGLFIPLVLSGVSRLMSAKNLRPAYYPLALVVLGLAGLGLFYLINPGLLTTLLRQFGVFTPGGAGAATTTEMQPFLSPQGSFTTSIAWGNYTTSIYIAPCVLLFLIGYKAIFRRQSSSEENLFLLWTLLMLVLTLIQRRFAYYLVVNIALLSAYFSWQAIWLAGLKKWAARLEPPEESVQKEKAKTDKHKKHLKRQGISIYQINAVLAVIVVFFFVFFPNIAKATEAQGSATAHFAPSDGWEQALYWMRDNTPEPFGDPDAYYMLYEKPPPGEDFKYPETAYGVTAWWDYGYWITRIAHRLPSTNPSQASIPIIKVANLFLSQDESSANKIMAELDSSYLMLDHDVAVDRLVYSVTTGLVKEEGKFNALCVWAEQNSSDFHEIYFVRYDESTYGPKIFYYPKYYNSTIVRLYNFNGEAVTEVHPLVIEYEELVYTDGEVYKIIKDVKEFSTYQEALDYVESAGPDNHRLVGVSPFISPIPLASMEAYKLVYSSVYSKQYSDNTTISEVKIFKFFGD